jgi:hypothetical protein
MAEEVQKAGAERDGQGAGSVPRAVARGRAVMGAKAEADAMQAAARTARYMLDAENEARSAVAISLKGGNPSPSHLVLF